MRHRPYGGVTSPNANETIEMIANCTGCRSTDLANGSSTVPTITIAGMASRKQPTTRKHNAIKKPAAIGPMPQVEALLANVSTWGMGPIAAGFFIALCFLVVGCFLDAIPAIVIVGTVLEPLARSVDLHPVQFAIISIVSLAFGLVTPPYGLCLMIACSIAGVRLRYALKDTMIMLVPMLLVLAALIIWPSVSLFLPRLIVPDMLK